MLSYHGLWAPAAKRRAEVVPALGGRVEHNRRKKTAPAEPKGEPAPACGHLKPAADQEVEGKARSPRLSGADCLQRAFFVT
jgi:hypothetical protein